MVSLQLLLEGVVVVDATLDLGELGGDQFLEARPEMLAAPGVHECRDLPDARQGETDPLGAADELKALEVALRVYPVPRRYPGRLGQQAKRLAVPDGLGIDAAYSGQLADSHGLPPLSGSLLPVGENIGLPVDWKCKDFFIHQCPLSNRQA
jgi:hypothetical protein